MLLTVIIVNYNVKHFLEQCLFSLREALQGIDAEIIVTDNNSSDGSVPYLHALFPEVSFIKNTSNPGFAKANNQAAVHAKGRYILFLNPDTLIPSDAIRQCISFIEQHHEAGALGIRMIDGSGHFLPESKRAFPSPITSLFKLCGLANLFPTSRIFARYHLGHLTPDANHEVDVLAGAFMLVKKEVIDSTGGFDETFFMYGEDIDLSYRIQAAGWKNYYFSGSSIIHFKGESTKKGSLNYVRMFYQAMNQFVVKHYSGSKAGIFHFFISLAIWLRALISSAGRFIRWVGLPFFDILVTLASIGLVSRFWESYVKPGIEYPARVLWTIVPLFTLVFIFAGGIAGLYDKWYRPSKAWIAMMLAIILNLAVYSLFDIDYRFSRGVILFGGILASAGILMLRYLLVKTGVLVIVDEKKELRQTLICGSEEAFSKVCTLMKMAGRNKRILGRVAGKDDDDNAAGTFTNLGLVLNSVPAREIIFCIDEEITLDGAMHFMQNERRSIRYKFYYPGSESIIGSDSKETVGEAVSGAENFAINSPENRRYKRITDIILSLLLIVLLPLEIFITRSPLRLLKNAFLIITGKKTWVGYCNPVNSYPLLKPAVLGCNSLPPSGNPFKNDSLKKLDYWYAKDYYWLIDVRVLLKGYRHLGS